MDTAATINSTRNTTTMPAITPVLSSVTPECVLFVVAWVVAARFPDPVFEGRSRGIDTVVGTLDPVAPGCAVALPVATTPSFVALPKTSTVVEVVPHANESRVTESPKLLDKALR